MCVKQIRSYEMLDFISYLNDLIKKKLGMIQSRTFQKTIVIPNYIRICAHTVGV
jgi:hypothetical protein